MTNAASLKSILVAFCVLGCFAGNPAAQMNFTDITASCGIIYQNFQSRAWDIAFVDINNDGINDIYCMDHNHQGEFDQYSIMYLSNSSIQLTNYTSTAFGPITSTGGGQGALAVDLNADGYLDLMTGSNDGVGCVFRNQGNGTYDWYTDFPGYRGDLSCREMSSGDMDGDGDLDVIICIHHSMMRIAVNNGQGAFSVNGVSWTGSEEPCGPTLPIVADMDNDGDLDIISQYMTLYGPPGACPGRNVTVDFWQNDGLGRFQWVSDTHGLMGGQEICTIMVGDYDNDADLDIIQLQHVSNGPNRYYNNDGTGHFTEESASRGLTDQDRLWTDAWSKSMCADLDNDGDVDLIFRGDVWTNDGTGNFVRADLPVSYSGRIAGAADLDGDGDLDLAGPRAGDYPESDGWWVYRNNSNDNRWLIVNVDGGSLNRFGVGSKVYVYEGARLVGYRQVINSSAMQQPLEQHFGLGSASTVRVKVIFPDGLETEVDNITAGQEITITRSGGQPSDPPPIPSGLIVAGTDIGCADLMWDIPDGSDNVLAYMIAWGPTPGTFTDSTLVSVTQFGTQGGRYLYSVCGLDDGQWCFSIRARNRTGQMSPYTTPVCANVTNGETQPLVPQNVTATQSDTDCVTVSWDDLGDPSVAGYWVYYGTESVQGGQATEYDDSVDAGSATSREICRFTQGTYYFAVKSYTGSGVKSAYSQERSVVIDNRPAAPQNVSATESALGRARITWDALSSPVTGYKVYFGDQSVADGDASEYGDSVDAGNNTSTEIPGFSAGTYYFAVKSYTAAGDLSVYSVQRSVVMQGVDDTPPTVTGMNPADRATAVPLNTGIHFTAADDKAGVDRASITVTVNGDDIYNFGFVGNPASLDVVAIPSSNLPENSTIDVSVTVFDLASPPNQHTEVWSFDTGNETIVDTVPPSFTSNSPSDRATDVPADVNDVRVTVQDNGMGIDMSSIEFYVNGGLVSYLTEGSLNNLTLAYENSSGFTPGSVVSVRVALSDRAGNPAERTFSFTIRSNIVGAPANDVGAIVPDGFWANDPVKPLEIRNLPISWTVRIFDTAGRLVRDHTNSAVDGADWSWDFTNDHGQRVARALYLVRVTDPSGNVRQSGNFLVQSDP